MSDLAQVDLNGDPKETVVDAAITADAFVPFLRALDFVDEYRLAIDSDGMHVCVTDPATVGMVDITLAADAFERFDVTDDRLLGINHASLGAAVSFARKEDTIQLSDDATSTLAVTVERDVAGIDVTGTRSVSVLDASSVRQPPDMPDLDLPASASMPPQAFVRLMREFPKDEHITISQQGPDLTFRFEGDHDVMQFTATVSGTGASSSRFATAYLHDVANAINAMDLDTLTIETGEEFPIRIAFERSGVYSGEYMIAPRITSD